MIEHGFILLPSNFYFLRAGVCIARSPLIDKASFELLLYSIEQPSNESTLAPSPPRPHRPLAHYPFVMKRARALIQAFQALALISCPVGATGKEGASPHERAITSSHSLKVHYLGQKFNGFGLLNLA